MSEKLGGDTAQLVDPDWPEGYSVPRNVMLSIKSWHRGRRGCGNLASKVAIEQEFHKIRGEGIFQSNVTPAILPHGNTMPQ